MKSKIIILEKATGETLTINNTFKNINECIKHLETIKKVNNIIIKKIMFEMECV